MAQYPEALAEAMSISAIELLSICCLEAVSLLHQLPGMVQIEIPANKLRQARILMVGAGGIGCELLKNLVLTGFGEIHIVDLDTIDLSNLNRQFLFRHEHIKKSKALVR